MIKMANENKSKITFVLYPWPGQLNEGVLENRYNQYWTVFLITKI